MGTKRTVLKELYELWYMAVKLNKGYKKWLENELPNYQAYWQELDSMVIPEGGITDSVRDDIATKVNYLFDKNMAYHALYEKFGDVHARPFEEWWKENAKLFTGDSIIDNYVNYVENDIRPAWINLQRNAYTAKARPEETDKFEAQFIKSYIKRIESSERRGYLHLKVDVFADIVELEKEFKRLVSDHKKKSKPWPFRPLKNLSPTRVHPNKIRLYLKTYEDTLSRRKENHKENWKETMKKVVPELKEKFDSLTKEQREAVRATYNDYIGKAKNLIKNAEHGNFPQHYPTKGKKRA